MEKLAMCRICLAENVCMYVVVNENLHDVFGKLTDIPFVTEDRRPMLTCWVCCAQLKKSYQFKKKCLLAEEMFAKMLNGDSEPLLLNQNHSQIPHGFNISPIEIISNIFEVGPTESYCLKEELLELPAVCEGQDDVIEPMDEQQSNNDLETENVSNDCPDMEYLQPYHSEPYSEDEMPFFGFKTEPFEKPKVSKKKRKAKKTNRAPVTKKPKLDTRRTKLGDTINAAPKIIQKTLKKKHIVEKPYKCNACNSSFTEKKNLKKHIITIHTGEKPYKCNACNSSFTEKKNLNKHTNSIHTGEKPYKCDVCQRSFLYQSTFRIHTRIHTGEKPYKCDICQRRFAISSDLAKHFLTHTGEKPFKCDICQRSFLHKGNLTCHVRTHSGEKPYKCKACNSTFTQKKNLRKHFRIKHEKTNYK